jgi:micrococcal nuclease
VHLDVDLGFDVRRRDSFRLYGIDAPELSQPGGLEAKTWLVEQIPADGMVEVRTHKDRREKYGRYLATLWIGDRNLSEEMILQGYAVRREG